MTEQVFPIDNPSCSGFSVSSAIVIEGWFPIISHKRSIRNPPASVSKLTKNPSTFLIFLSLYRRIGVSSLGSICTTCYLDSFLGGSLFILCITADEFLTSLDFLSWGECGLSALSILSDLTLCSSAVPVPAATGTSPL